MTDTPRRLPAPSANQQRQRSIGDVSGRGDDRAADEVPEGRLRSRGVRRTASCSALGTKPNDLDGVSERFEAARPGHRGDPLVQDLRREFLDPTARLTDEVVVMGRCARRIAHAPHPTFDPVEAQQRAEGTRRSKVRRRYPAPRHTRRANSPMSCRAAKGSRRRSAAAMTSRRGDVRRRPE